MKLDDITESIFFWKNYNNTEFKSNKMVKDRLEELKRVNILNKPEGKTNIND